MIRLIGFVICVVACICFPPLFFIALGFFGLLLLLTPSG